MSYDPDDLTPDSPANLAAPAVRTDGPPLVPPDNTAEEVECRECGAEISEERKLGLCDPCTAGQLFDAKAEILDQQKRLDTMKREMVAMQRERDDAVSRANVLEDMRRYDGALLAYARGFVRSMRAGCGACTNAEISERLDILAEKLGPVTP